MSKPQVAFYWCASCGGCEESVVDLAENVLTVIDAVDFRFFPVAMDFKRSDVEAMADGELAVCFINGAIRSSEQQEMAELLRRKSQILIAYGACATSGGIPALANLKQHSDLLKEVYEAGVTTENPSKVRPQLKTTVPEGTLELPELYETVKCLDQVVDVDYYIPGCAPPTALLLNAVLAILEGKIPPKGAVLAPDVALCDECARKETKPEKMLIDDYKRPVQAEIDREKCILAQGFLCLGPETRQGCGAPCPQANMPCTGCQGPTSRVVDYGAKALSTMASIYNSNDEGKIARAMEDFLDPAGTFYRYSMSKSLLYRRLNFD